MTTRTDEQLAIIERLRGEYLDGTVFHRYANSEQSVIGYEPAAPEAMHRRFLLALARYAQQGREQTHLALAIRVSPIGRTPSQLAASIWRQAARAIEQGWDDVIARSGPEPGRYSDHQHRYSLYAILQFERFVKEDALQHRHGLGWAAQDLWDEESKR